MERRHLRYFIAVAEEGRFLTAAQRLPQHVTAVPQPADSCFESEVGVELLERQPRGVALTDAGKVFLDHARLALSQVEAAAIGARRIAQPQKPTLSMGFMVGLEGDLAPPLAAYPPRGPQDLVREIYVSSARTSPILHAVIQDYASKLGIVLKASYEGENISSAMSLVASTGGVTLVPLYAPTSSRCESPLQVATD
ncbi:LysR family transcriptional regulator [Bradyrhizobium oligotrophicum]|uniref:LysR family transcriptional regulator n=1 Tax=Bradyrhizobium oligotrophicum TaxID=44255 RepID=UPI003EB8C1B2